RHLVSLPPDLNPIEYFWSWLKRKIRSLKLKFDSLADAIQYALS
ncbi:MAG: IS630 family transposase, partial [Holosporaceae bacterium]|nr:IS630 family transposase [Holosporaceae bacterium]